MKNRKGDTVLFVVGGPLPGMNEIIHAYSSSRHVGNALKQKTEEDIGRCIRKQLKGIKINSANFYFVWYERDMRRNPDNINSAQKFFFDAFQKEKVLLNDGWKQNRNSPYICKVDPNYPRVEVYIKILEERVEQGELF